MACKACPCGHSFFSARRTARVLSPGEDIRRRTQRVKREKPNYYDSLEYEKQTRRARLRNSECDDDDYMKKDGIKPKKKKVKKEEEEEEDMFSNLSAEKQAQYALILGELNRKLQLVTWKPT